MNVSIDDLCRRVRLRCGHSSGCGCSDKFSSAQYTHGQRCECIRNSFSSLETSAASIRPQVAFPQK
jgi:hypothetical protein